MLFEHFRQGINLGGWLAQYDINEPHPFTDQERNRHFESFIQQKHLQQISGWRLDHIRLPIDAKVLAQEEAPYMLVKDTVETIRQCALWCKEEGLNLVIDLHDIKGNQYGQMEKPIPLLTSPDIRNRFVAIWVQLARALKDLREPVIMFELFNEICDATGYLWRRLYRRTIAAIRAEDATRWILVGSNHANSVRYLSQLDLLDDPLVFYNFHFYDPQAFTHQRAHFSEEMREFGQGLAYPGDMTGFRNYLRSNPQWQSKHRLVLEETCNDLDLMTRLLQDARVFTQYSGKELYCGEYGVIDTAPPLEAAKWLLDFARLADEYRFGRALWNYKTLDFGLLDKDDNIIFPQLVKALFGGVILEERGEKE